MHSIKSSGRREAWRYYDGESRNYNPFARSSHQRRQQDEEAPLQTRATTGSLRSRPTPADDDFQRPQRSDTAPQSSTTHPSREDLNQDLGGAELDSGTTKNSDTGSGPNGSTFSQAATRQGTEKPEAQQTTSHEQQGLRQRVQRKLHLDKPNDEADDVSKTSKKRPKIPVAKQFKAVVLGSWINILLVAVPVSFALNYAHLNGVAVFVVSFVAIIPLASTLSFATEELALYTGQTLGGLLNATFGNATELIVSIIALSQKKIVIVQTSLLGSMLSNLLLVLGMCFFFGGLTRVKQHFNITVAQTASSILALSIGSLLIPTAFVRFGTDTNADTTRAGVGPISRGTSVILLLVYGSYLFFQLKTHTDMYNEPSKKAPKRESGRKEKGDVMQSMAMVGANHAASAGGIANKAREIMHHSDDDDDDGEEQPTLSVWGAIVTLTIATVLIAFCSEFLVTGIDAIAGSISQEFIGLILLPIVGNAAEHATAVTVACKDKMDLAIGVAVGSSMQIALLVLPLMVIIGWCGLGQGPTPLDIMDLDFDGFQIAVLFIAVLLVNYLIQDGESHWLEGVLLMATYIIIAIAAYFYPVTESLAG